MTRCMFLRRSATPRFRFPIFDWITIFFVATSQPTTATLLLNLRLLTNLRLNNWTGRPNRFFHIFLIVFRLELIRCLLIGLFHFFLSKVMVVFGQWANVNVLRHVIIISKCLRKTPCININIESTNF